MENSLTIFEGQELEILTKEDINFDFEGSVLFHGKQSSKILGYADNCLNEESERVNLSKAITNHVDDDCKYLVTKESFRNQNSYELYSIGKRGEIFINEDGVFDLIYNSKMPKAKEFKKKVKDIVKKVQQTGKYDVVENKIQAIEDEKEKNLSLTVYNLEQAVKNNPTDMLMMFTYNSKKQELDTYKELKRIETENKKLINEVNNKVDELTEENKKLKEDTDLIKSQQVYICNRTNFYERVTILGNKYFGRDIQEAYRALYSKMKVLGSFDVYTRRKHEWEALNAERAKAGKKPYKDSTLKSKYNMLDVIDKFNKWELCSEAYKTIETEMYNKVS
jgi:prophage antirepressor-like protein